MKTCKYCNDQIVGQGKTSGIYKFCSSTCLEKGTFILVYEKLPQDLLDERVKATHQGHCPRCLGSGPVDVYTSHVIWSYILASSYKTTSQISCRMCALKTLLTNVFVSFVFGWWSFPWGLLMTPVQIVKNALELINGPDDLIPSEKLIQQVGSIEIREWLQKE